MDPRFQAIRLRQSAEPPIECWDDDGDLQCINDLQFRIASKAHLRANSIVRPLGQPGHRDSIFSHRSLHSDSDLGDLDDDSAFLLDEADQSFSQVALSALQSGTLPGLSNASAPTLRGATMKQQSETQEKKDTIQTDGWTDGLALTSIVGKLELKLPPAVPFPDTLSSPRKSPLSWLQDVPRPDVAPKEAVIPPQKEEIHEIPSERFAQNQDDTIKLSSLSQKPQSTLSISDAFTDPSAATCSTTQQPDSAKNAGDEEDAEIPSDTTLKLKQRQAKDDEERISDDADSEWAEGSLGVRHGGTKSEQARRSSAVYSPSISSRLTVESEDDGLDGLVVPNDTSSLVEALQQKLDNERHEQLPSLSPKNNKVVGRQSSSPCADDFFADFVIDGDTSFANRKTQVYEPVKQPQQPVSSIDRRLTASPVPNLKTASGLATRIPRPTVYHDRSQSAHNLSANAPQPVTEGGTSSRYNRSRSQLGTYASVPPTSGIPVPVTNTSSQQSELSRNPARGLKSREGFNPRSRPSTQGLKSRRSVSTVRTHGFNPNAASQKQGRITRAASVSRSKTPVERGPAASRSGTLRRNMPPYLSTGTARRQSHHANMRSAAKPQRRSCFGSLDMTDDNRSFHKVRSASVSTEHKVGGVTPQSGPNDSKRPMAKPKRSKEFGDGTELDVFDDLPTSASAESKFVKKPSRFSTQRSLRLKVSNQSSLSKSSRTAESVPSSPFRSGFKPRFAWDTKSSRNAREQKIDAMTARERDRERAPSTQPAASPPKSLPRQSCSPAPSPAQPKTPKNSKPHLIRPMGSGVHDMKYVKGMRYNPALYRWEGNENAISDFHDALSPVAPKVAPALIANVGTMTGVQIVNGMVFDPQRMCWVKLARSQDGTETVTIPPEEDDDPFFDLPDLEDKPKGNTWKRESSKSREPAFADADDNDRSGDESDDWPITEEFDVGPEFIRRQRAEEDKWRRRLRKWLRDDTNGHDDNWRWAIRDIVNDDFLQNLQGNSHPENAQP